MNWPGVWPEVYEVYEPPLPRLGQTDATSPSELSG
jgi:hypothetical protein